jgi:hypothetical protein
VTENNPGAPVSEVQDQAILLIRSLISEGLFDVGDLSGRGAQFVAWDTPLDESMQRIHDLYVKRFDDKSDWPWAVWLKLTDKGESVARSVAERGED